MVSQRTLCIRLRPPVRVACQYKWMSNSFPRASKLSSILPIQTVFQAMDAKPLLLTLLLIHGLLVSQTEAASRSSTDLVPAGDHRHSFFVVSKRDLAPPPSPHCNTQIHQLC
ncbi:hypothetical protein V6N13_065882 [Hibiscus sabdariffa]|uniref:Uncharacterized protein n=1 Tax=Hibiscus sabdariffa TaxID=183260 RepID=A0ABR2BJM4_9ROSI